MGIFEIVVKSYNFHYITPFTICKHTTSWYMHARLLLYILPSLFILKSYITIINKYELSFLSRTPNKRYFVIKTIQTAEHSRAGSLK